MTRRALALLIGAVLALPFLPAPAQARQVALELVLAVDASSSVDYEEFDLQMRGYAEAFRDERVKEAIAALGPDGMAVTLVLWSGSDQQAVAVEWTHMSGDGGADSFAEMVALAPRQFAFGATAIGDMMAYAAGLFEGNGFEGGRMVLDISGDGRTNQGLPPETVREALLDAGITINALAILNEEPDLDAYYAAAVVGGQSAFVMSVDDYESFGEALVSKLLREIGGPAVASIPLPALAGR